MIRVKFAIILFVAALCLPKAVFASEALVSNYLYEYGVECYKAGNTRDAIHELKKSLIADPDNLRARRFLHKIAPMSISVDASPKFACPFNKIKFNLKINSAYNTNNLTYVWDFGDGAIREGFLNEAHTYKNGGLYTVKVKVSDGLKAARLSSLATVKVKINSSPKADAGKSVVCCLGADALFDGSNSSDADGDKLSYFWDFGDGNTGQGVKVAHRYSKAGEYDISLTVKDDSRSLCSTSRCSFRAVVHEKPVSVIKVREKY